MLHITTALHLQMSVSLQGPTECGKFETINGLAKFLGRLMIAFCCNHTTSIQEFQIAIEGKFGDCSICNILIHINFFCAAVAKLGAWGVFKDILSVPSNTLQKISYYVAKFLKALVSNKSEVRFHDSDLQIHPDTAVFLTLTKSTFNQNNLSISKLYYS